ncbi:Ig-like domain repeat protein [Gordonia lacunae]|uniref:Ig-like domain repeat protein n=1 Tax=Gordonia lacunae TaxID=417102 RepID=UPI0039E57C4B
MEPFVGNDYRKRVLAAVERRGGPNASDSFELYDLPIEEAERLDDDAVAARLDEVWAFWQKHRDHPKYRILVARLVAEHDERSAPLRHKTGRIAEARAVSTRRELRDQQRFELLDNAVARLNERYGGIPRSKRAGLDEIGAMGGLDPAEVATRLRRHRIVDDAPAAPAGPMPPRVALTAQRRAQIVDLLAEFDRLRDGDPTPTLLTLLHLDTDAAADRGVIESRAVALNDRARELAAGRFRAVLDELLVHVHDILLTDPALAQDYRQSVVDTVTDHLRPRVRAAVLVEDELGAQDHEFLLDEARAGGLGARDARTVIASLAAEFGAAVNPPAGGPARAEPPPTRLWANDLRAARAALRDALPVRARSAIADARASAGDDGEALRQIAAVADEVERVIRQAVTDARRARDLADEKRHVAALELLEGVFRRARDIDLLPEAGDRLAERLEQSRDVVARADAAARAASAGDPASLSAAAQMRRQIVDHDALDMSAAGVTVDPPRNVRSVADGGAITVSWDPSATESVTYRVVRIAADGSTRTLGRTTSTELSDGSAPDPVPPVYEVIALHAGHRSEPARTGSTSGPSADAGSTVPVRPVTPRPDDPPPVTAVRVEGDTVCFEWPVGVTEAMVVIRPDAAPDHPADPAAVASKVTNTRYQIDGGYPIPSNIPRPCHVAVASCRRTPQGKLDVASVFGPSARAQAPATGAAG